MASSSRIFW